MPDHPDLLRWTISGGAAGLIVDVALYPLDTLKTRLQADEGFKAAGGFRHLYRGLGSIALGSAPSYALFFGVYEVLKVISETNGVASEALCASVSEIVSLLIVNPMEVIKQRTQAGKASTISLVAKRILKNDGFTGFYRGYGSLAARAVPFTCIEIPIWETAKRKISSFNEKETCTPFESAIAGMFAGCVASMATMPMDVAKTRIMLSDKNMSSIQTIIQIGKFEGVSKLFAGCVPRTISVAVGGFVFFFAYEFALTASQNIITSNQ